MKWLALLLLSSCSTVVQPTGIDLRCKTVKDECPDPTRVDQIVRIFANRVPGFDPSAYVEVKWYDSDVCLDHPVVKCAIGLTHSDGTVEVTSERVLVHELMHVHLKRCTGDADGTHADPPGPWTEGADELIRQIQTEIGE